MQLDSLKRLYLEEVKQLYDAEIQIVEVMLRMTSAANSLGLRKSLTQHLEESKTHVLRLEQIFDHMAGEPQARVCKGMRAILEEQDEVLDGSLEGPALDMAIIAAVQKIEHYEISAYGSVRTFASLLGDNEALELLQVTLDEEKVTEGTLKDLIKQIAFEALDATSSRSL